MTCEHCGADLPAFALFCGECGRSVAAAPRMIGQPAHPPAMPLSDVGDASIDAARVTVPVPGPVVAPVQESVPEPVPERAPVPEPVPHPEPVARIAPCAACGLVPEPDDLYCADCGSALAAETRIIQPIGRAEPMPEPPVPIAAALAPVMPTMPEPLPATAVAATTVDDESTRLVPRGTGGARFVLQFSTGESYTVLGSGLAGRNPRAEPGEYVDHLVTVVDPGRSVSKTHFEFGQESGVFWFVDRHSGNGSVIREPGAPPRPCVPGRRYPIVRGTRIDIGEQFVVVS